MKNLLDGRNKEMKDSYELYESFFVIILLESIEEKYHVNYTWGICIPRTGNN